MSEQSNQQACERQVIDSAKGYEPWYVPGRRQGSKDVVAPAEATAPADPVNHPEHYCRHPSGVECIQITEHMGFNLGNAVKYIWRADLKGQAVDDLRKARWYIERELARRGVVG